MITAVCLGEHRAFAVECFVKTESYIAVRCAFCKKFKIRRHDSVLPCVIIISKQMKTFQETSVATSVRVVGRKRSVRTAEKCKGAVQVAPQTSLCQHASLLCCLLNKAHRMLSMILVIAPTNCRLFKSWKIPILNDWKMLEDAELFLATMHTSNWMGV